MHLFAFTFSFRPRKLARCLICINGFLAHFFLVSTSQAATYLVNDNGDPASGSAANCAAANANTCTLRDAIAAAISGSDTIAFNGDMTITPGSTFTLASNIAIDGTGGAVVLDGDNAVALFVISNGVSVQMTDLTIRNGFAMPVVFYGSTGGAITNNSGTLTLTRCSLTNNSAYLGGAIFNNVGTVNLVDSALTDNSATLQGGAIQNQGTVNLIHSTLSDNSSEIGGGILNAGALNLTDSTLSDNHAIGNGAQGGGIFNVGGPMTFVRSTVSGNSAEQGGGIFNDDGGTLTLTNSTFSGNHALTTGGGIFSASGTVVTLTNSTLSGNTDDTAGGIYTVPGSELSLFNSIVGDGCEGTGTPEDLGGNLDSGTSCTLSAVNSKNNATLNLGPLQDNGGPTQTLLQGANSDAINFIVCTNAATTDQRDMIRPDPSSAALPTPCDSGAVEANSIPQPNEIFFNGFES